MTVVLALHRRKAARKHYMHRSRGWVMSGTRWYPMTGLLHHLYSPGLWGSRVEGSGVEWSGVVWYGMAWCGVVWCTAVRQWRTACMEQRY